MQRNNVELSVGLFMLAGLLALIVLAFKVSGLAFDSVNRPTYKVYASFENLGGLKKRSKVSLAGVLVGRITDITLDKENYQALVEMEIYSDVDNLTTDTSAAILTAGLLGEKYVGLSVGADEEFLVDGDRIYDTQSAVVLEELIGQFLFNQVNE